MIKAVLLDLDDTLLVNADRVFVPEYIRLVDDFFAERWGFMDMGHVLYQFIRTASGPRDPRQTNTELAESIITHATKYTAEEIRAAFAYFYGEIYLRLRDCVKPVPFAASIFERLRQQDYAVVIATNPLYPPEAIRQRLAWAGLPDDLAAYALVTHSDNMHFAKPDPAYYAEIIARVGVEPDETLMVGDSPGNDIQPAALLGLHTYFVPQQSTLQLVEGVDATGSLSDFHDLIMHDGWAEPFGANPPTPEAIAPQMRGNMGALFGLLALVQPGDWHRHPDPNEWSIMEIVCHLLVSEDTVQRPRLERILAEDNPFLSATKPPPGPGAMDSCDADGYHATERLWERRQVTLDWLSHLMPEDWQRPARHSIFGLTTLLEMAHFTAQHDRLHLNQLCQTLGRCRDV